MCVPINQSTNQRSHFANYSEYVLRVPTRVVVIRNRVVVIRKVCVCEVQVVHTTNNIAFKSSTTVHDIRTSYTTCMYVHVHVLAVHVCMYRYVCVCMDVCTGTYAHATTTTTKRREEKRSREHQTKHTYIHTYMYIHNVHTYIAVARFYCQTNRRVRTVHVHVPVW